MCGTSHRSGSVGLLIGFSYAAYQPVKIEGVGHLLLMRNRFGSIIAGSHPTIKETTRKVVKHAIVLHSLGNFEEFQSIESLGVVCSPKCGGCRCGTCQTGGKDMTIVEEKEYEMIRSGLSFNQATGKWLANYPWIVDPNCLPDNMHFAYATLMSTEKRLAKNPLYAETYQDQIGDMLKREVARRISDHELQEYTGAKFYISHHDVMSPRSVSTPMRVVFNSSARIKGGISLNDCLAKGPCLLNELLGILMRFRQDRFAHWRHKQDVPLNRDTNSGSNDPSFFVERHAAEQETRHLCYGGSEHGRQASISDRPNSIEDDSGRGLWTLSRSERDDYEEQLHG